MRLQGYSRQAHCTSFTLAEWLCRTADRIDPARVFGPHHCLGQGTSASDSEKLCGLLQRRENASVIEQGCACLSPGSAIRRHKFARHTGRTSSSICSDLDFRYTPPGSIGAVNFEALIRAAVLMGQPHVVEHRAC